MTARKLRPLLVQGALTGAVYIVTRYRIEEDGQIIAHEKYDVTGEFLVCDRSKAEALTDALPIGWKEMDEVS